MLIYTSDMISWKWDFTTVVFLPKILTADKSIFLRFYLFLFLERGEGRKKRRETWMCGCLSCATSWGPGPKPRHVSWLGLEPATLCFAVWCPIHWATSARTQQTNLNRGSLYKIPNQYFPKMLRSLITKEVWEIVTGRGA